jgi:hypothetical protein
MSLDIDLSKQGVTYEDEAVKEAINRILSNQYKRDVRITGFSREEIRSWEHSDVFRLYPQLASCDAMTVILKQFNPGVNDENIIALYEALGRMLSGERIAPEFYETVCDVEKKRYWLFMEDIGKNLVRGRRDWENEEMSHCLGFVEKLAKIHLLFAEKEEELRALRCLQVPPYPHAVWRDRCESAIKSMPDNIEKIVQTGKLPWLNEMANEFVTILEPCLPVIDSLVPHLSFSFTHADKSPEENMIIGREGEEPIYYFIDWDGLVFVPVLDDLAGFLGYGRETTDESTLIERYWECVQGSPLVPLEKGECQIIYKYFKLINSIRSVHHHAGRLIQKQFRDVWHEGVLRQILPFAIKLAKELQMM